MVTAIDRCERTRPIEELQAGAAAARANLERRPADWLLPQAKGRRAAPQAKGRRPPACP
jgi:hypothetical protein